MAADGNWRHGMVTRRQASARLQTLTPHYRPGADTNHFLGCCEECDAHYLAKATLGQVESWFRHGHITLDQFEAFRHVWASSAPRFGDYSAWTAAPVAEVARHAELIRTALRDS